MENLLKIKNADENFEIEYELISTKDQSAVSERQRDIDHKLAIIEERLEKNQNRIDTLNVEIDRLTSHADKIDYMVAIGSGILAGMIDSLWVGEFSLERGKEWSSNEINNFVKGVAQSNFVNELARERGYREFKGNDLQGAISFLEQFGTPSDSVTASFGGGKQHHLRDFAHHPTPVGLMFSMLSQFTEMAYGTNTAGVFQVIPITNKTFIGQSFPEKIIFGLVFWLIHMASDMAGSNAYAGAGTGLPGPILSLVKELSSLPILGDSAKVNELRVNISKLFNGTLLAQRDENGRMMRGPDGKPLIERFDLRAEMGVAHELGRQAIPVVVNEALVRGFYFFRRLVQQIKEKNNLKDIEWKKTLPFKNRTIVRMLTISTGTFTAFDMADAAIRSAIKSGGITPAFWGNFALRINIVGVGRFVVAIGTDISMGVQRNKLRNERMTIYMEQLRLCNAKVYYKQANMWIAAESAGQAINEACIVANNAIKFFAESVKEIEDDINKISEHITDAEENNPGLREDILNELIWG